MEQHNIACSCGQEFENFNDLEDHRNEEIVETTVSTVKEVLSDSSQNFLEYNHYMENILYVDIDLGEDTKLSLRKFTEAGLDVSCIYTNVDLRSYDVDNMARLWFDVLK